MKKLYIIIFILFFYSILRVNQKLEHKKKKTLTEEYIKLYKTLNGYKQDLVEVIDKETSRLMEMLELSNQVK